MTKSSPASAVAGVPHHPGPQLPGVAVLVWVGRPFIYGSDRNGGLYVFKEKGSGCGK